MRGMSSCVSLRLPLYVIYPGIDQQTSSPATSDGRYSDITVSRYTAHQIYTVPEPPWSRYFTVLFINAIL